MKRLIRSIVALAASFTLFSGTLAHAQPPAASASATTLSEADHVAIARAILDMKRSVEKWSAAAQVLDLIANGAIVASIAAIGMTAPVGSLPGILALAGAGAINISALLTDLRAKNLQRKAEQMEAQFREMAGPDADRYFRAAMFAPYVGAGSNVGRTAGTVPSGTVTPSVSAGGASGAGMVR
jgi:hypothetical protein